jgi:hypothetical protein
MIDTDKYEGHRQPWVFTAGVSYPMSKADIALRQDAPLLLAEVKRLREQEKKILQLAETNMALEWGDTNHSFEWGYIIDMIKGWTE